MKAVDRLRCWSVDVPPVAYSWSALALSGPEVMELLGLVDGLEHRVAELEAAARRCADCGRPARNLKAWTRNGLRDVIYLGPGCLRKRVEGSRQEAQALPIGGAR